MANISRMVAVGTGIAPATAIIASQLGSVVQIQEDPAEGSTWPKTDLLIFHVTPTGVQSTVSRRLPAGQTYTFQKGQNGTYYPAEVIGFIATVTGTADILVDESGV